MVAGPLNSGQVRVAGSGAIWYAPAGTTVPTDSVTAWGASFVNLGYQTDGFTVTQSLKTTGIAAWQTTEQVRLINTELIRSVQFENIQSNTSTIALAWGGATVTAGTGGAYTLNIPSGQLASFVIGIDWSDGITNQRFILPNASLLTLPTIKYTRTDAVRFAMDVQALVPSTGGASMVSYGSDTGVATNS